MLAKIYFIYYTRGVRQTYVNINDESLKEEYSQWQKKY